MTNQASNPFDIKPGQVVSGFLISNKPKPSNNFNTIPINNTVNNANSSDQKINYGIYYFFVKQKFIANWNWNDLVLIYNFVTEN